MQKERIAADRKLLTSSSYEIKAIMPHDIAKKALEDLNTNDAICPGDLLPHV